MSLKKNIVILALMLAAALSARAQANMVDISLAEQWKYAFSAEGRQNWKPEITARGYVAFYTDGLALTVGARIDEKRTLGLMVSNNNFFYDAGPATGNSIMAGLYMRRYIHLGPRRIISFYNDVTVGAMVMYRYTGYRDSSFGSGLGPGYTEFFAAWQPGVKIRFYKNIHLFFGPMLLTSSFFGLYVGVGF